MPAVSRRQADTIDRLCVAAEAEVRDVGYEQLTVRNVARRAGVAPATAYTYFSSKEHLVTEVFWRRLVRGSGTVHHNDDDIAARVSATLTDLSLLVADAPELAAACTVAMLSNETAVKAVRDRIGLEWRRRLLDSLGPGADPLVLSALEFLISGALVHAGTEHLSYSDLPARLAGMARLICTNAEVTAP